eukprot:1409600-Rhodomonas_salina.2
MSRYPSYSAASCIANLLLTRTTCSPAASPSCTNHLATSSISAGPSHTTVARTGSRMCAANGGPARAPPSSGGFEPASGNGRA